MFYIQILAPLNKSLWFSGYQLLCCFCRASAIGCSGPHFSLPSCSVLGKADSYKLHQQTSAPFSFQTGFSIGTLAGEWWMMHVCCTSDSELNHCAAFSLDLWESPSSEKSFGFPMSFSLSPGIRMGYSSQKESRWLSGTEFTDKGLHVLNAQVEAPFCEKGGFSSGGSLPTCEMGLSSKTVSRALFSLSVWECLCNWAGILNSCLTEVISSPQRV